MKILVTGANGQLGEVLKRTNPGENECIFCNKEELDITNQKASAKLINEFKPDWIINTAAFTEVDKAEELQELTFKVNAEAPKNLCEILCKSGGRLLQISTDFVFNGKQSHPYSFDDNVDPISAYGASKAQAEKYILNYQRHIILRTSWLYSDFGKNFLNTMLELAKKNFSTNQPLKVISDQIGTPTSAYSLAYLCWEIVGSNKLEGSKSSIFHWSDSGLASWYDFAHAIGELSVRNDLISKFPLVMPILSEDFNSKALRPKYSVLNCFPTKKFFNIKPSHWREELDKVLKKHFLNYSN